jgi:hypothetical protein
MNMGYSFLLKKNYNQFTNLVNVVLKYLLDYPAFINLGLL